MVINLELYGLEYIAQIKSNADTGLVSIALVDEAFLAQPIYCHSATLSDICDTIATYSGLDPHDHSVQQAATKIAFLVDTHLDRNAVVAETPNQMKTAVAF